MKETKEIFRGIYLDKKTDDILTAMAKSKKVTKSKLIRNLIENSLLELKNVN